MSDDRARQRPLHILLVEDDEGDVVMTREAIGEGHLDTQLSVVGDGVAALDFLRRRGRFAKAPTPDLVLLDLNLPGRDGREVLGEVKSDVDLRGVPVVVLTTSEAEEDIRQSYALHANAYITKPVDFDKFVDVVRQVDRFFGSVVRLPS